MSNFDPLPFLQRARNSREARSAQLLETLSGNPAPTWKPWTQENEEELAALQAEAEEWPTEET